MRYLTGNIKPKRLHSSFGVDYQDASTILAPMATQEPTAAPALFVRLLRKSIADQGLSLREIARQIGASTAYMSRLVNEQRGLPADETILKLEDVLDIPRGKLLYAAGRLDSAASRVLMKQDAGILMRTLSKLTDKEMAQVQKVAEKLVNTRKMETQ
jgi:transcriptional regulator with XRE-family HTH domain